MKNLIISLALVVAAGASFLQASDVGSGRVSPAERSADRAGGGVVPPLPLTVGPLLSSDGRRPTPSTSLSTAPSAPPRLNSRPGSRVKKAHTACSNTTAGTEFEAPETLDLISKQITDDRNEAARVGGEFYWNTSAVSELLSSEDSPRDNLTITALFRGARDIGQPHLRWVHYDVEDIADGCPIRQSIWYLVTADRVLDIDERDIVTPVVVPEEDGWPLYMELKKKNAATHIAFRAKMQAAQAKERARVELLRLRRDRPKVSDKELDLAECGEVPDGVALWQWMAMVVEPGKFFDVKKIEVEGKNIARTFMIRFFQNLEYVLLSSAHISYFSLDDFERVQHSLHTLIADDNPFTQVDGDFTALMFPRLHRLELPEACALTEAMSARMLACMPALKELMAGGVTYDEAALSALRLKQKEEAAVTTAACSETGISLKRRILSLAVPAAFILTVAWADKRGYLTGDPARRFCQSVKDLVARSVSAF